MKIKCYCGNFGRIVNDRFVCNACVSAGREGSPWPGGYYDEVNLDDRSGAFIDGSRAPKGRVMVRRPEPRDSGWGYVPGPRPVAEIDSRTEMYGNLVVKSREDLADLFDLYNLKKVAVHGGDGPLVEAFSSRPSLKVTPVESLKEVPYSDAVYLCAPEDVERWHAAVRIGGILAGGNYQEPRVREEVLLLCRKANCDLHRVTETGNVSWYVWKRG